MGAWGSGPLENDAAIDLVARFGARSWSAVVEALAACDAAASSTAQEAGVAGGLLVAASRSGAVDAGPVAAAELAEHGRAPDELVGRAKAAVMAAQLPGELRHLWSEDEENIHELRSWLQGLDDLDFALGR